jgi:DNA polymerase, archaea type
MKLDFIPIDYDTFDFQDKNYIRIFGKNSENQKICLIDTCPPYFWAILRPNLSDKKIKKLIEKIKPLKVSIQNRTSKIEKIEIKNKNFLEKPVKALKIYITNYKDATKFREKFDFEEIQKIRGYDLGFITHYILEKKIEPLKNYEIQGEILHNSEKFGSIDSIIETDFVIELKNHKEINPKTPNLKVLAYDIETTEFEIGKGEILMISLYGKDFKKVLTCKESSKKSWVKKLKDESELLEEFLKQIKKYSPDILVGYFSDGFDLPYLKERAKKNKIKLTLGIDQSEPKFTRGALMKARINGIVHLDLLRFIRNTYSQYLQSETLSLNEVSNELLGDEKHEFDILKNMKKEKIDWEEFYKYNLQDSKLTYDLTEKMLPDLIAFTKIVREPLFEVSRNTMASNFEDYVLHNLERFNEISEKRPFNSEIEKRRRDPRYEGAFVFQPTPGLYENIEFFDFSSMYGSIIVSYNLSKPTRTESKKNSYKGDYNGKPVYFRKKQGFIPRLMSELIEKRRKAKKEYQKNKSPLTKARSNAFKLIANAAYGYQGFFGARYYSIEAAASTAYFARENIKKAIKNFEKKGFKVIYSDTDSIAIKLEDKTKTQAKKALKEINDKLPGIMELESEGYFKRGIWVTKRTGEYGAKKKYALIDEKNQIKIRGFETVRRDWCQLARKTQNKVLELILKNGNEKQALKYLLEVIEKIKKRKISKDELIIKTQLKKPISEYKTESPHVTIAKKMRKLEIPTNIGTLIEYYIAENSGKKLIRERAKLPSENGNYDIEYYLNNQIIPSVENILEVFGINTKEITSGKKQEKLGKWF